MKNTDGHQLFLGNVGEKQFAGRIKLLFLSVLALFWSANFLSGQTLPLAARVYNGAQVNGTITGSVQQMQGQNTTLNSGAIITGDLYVPGIPTLQKNGSPQFQGIELGTGATTPTGYTITLNTGSQLRYLIERTNAVTFTSVPNPPAPTGTRDINVNPGNVSSQIGTWSTVHNLNLNSNVGAVTVPAGSYGTFTANSGTSFVLGTTGATTASTYSFDALTLNSTSSLTINGPVIIQVKNGVSVNSGCVFGNSSNPSWTTLNITTGGLTINSNGTLYGFVQAPTSSVNINGKLVGSVISSNQLTVNSGGSIQGQAQNSAQPPTVSITNPTNNEVVQGNTATIIQATASDPQGQGTITKVDFYENNGSGAVKIGTSTSSPYSVTFSPAPGTYTLTAVATDSLGLTATSSPVTLYSNFPPGLQVSTSNTVFLAGGNLTINSAATDSDGSVALVQFYANGNLIGQSTSAPFSFTWTNVAAGNYSITVKATDNEGGVTTSSPISIVSALPPTISIASPSTNTNFQSPTNVTILATASSPNTNGTISKVDFYANNGTSNVKLGTSTTAPYSYTWTQPALGPYTLTAVATDNYGYTTTSSPVNIFVNQPPTTNVTTSATSGVVLASRGLVITSNAQDALGQISDVQFFANGQLTGDVKSGSFNYTWTNPAPGSYQITVTASDNHGGVTTSAPVNVTVALPPVVAITTPLTGAIIQSPANVMIQATASTTNASGTIAKVDFYESDGTNTNKLGSSTTAPYAITWSGPPIGNYTLTALATDNYGFTTTSAPVAILVNQPPTENVSTSAINGVIVSTGSLLITSNARDALGQITGVQFFANGQLIGTVTSGPFNYNWTNLTAGTYQITVKATDNNGGVTTSLPISITVDQPPTVSISSPTDGTQVQNPANISICATAASPDTNGSIAKVDFFADTGTGPVQVGEVTQSPYNFTWNQPAPGTYAVTAVATDNLGITTTSAPVHVQVYGWNTLTEGSQFLTEQSYAITIPANLQILAIPFRNLNFDTTAQGLNKDAFEIALVDASGNPLVSTIAPGRDSFYNVSEVGTPASAQGVASSTTNGITTIYVNIAQIPAGTKATLIARLVNNDADTATTVQVAQLLGYPSTSPASVPYADSTEILPSRPLDFSSLDNLTSSFVTQFDRSSFNDQATIYYVRFAAQNVGQYLFKGRLAAVLDQVSDPSVTLADADGTTPYGYPYIDLTPSIVSGSLAVQSSSQERTIAFNNPNHVQFTYHISYYGDPDHPPAFSGTPTPNAYIGRNYISTDKATDADKDGITYSIISGPAGLTIDPTSGALTWSPASTATPSSYLVTVSANDGRGGATTQTFSINLQQPPPNRPPIFVSTPVVDASVGWGYLYTAQATDLDSTTLTYSVVNAPSGFSLNSTTGVVTWTPTATESGLQTVVLQVADGNGLIATQSYQANVSPQIGEHPPVFVSTPITTITIPVGQDVQTATATNQWNPTQANAFVNLLESNPPIPAPGLCLWLKADQGVTTGANQVVNGWSDQSPSGYLATQNSSNNQPFLVTDGQTGMPALKFNGNQWLLSTALVPANQDLTIVTVNNTSSNSALTVAASLGIIYGGTGNAGGVRGVGYRANQPEFDDWQGSAQAGTAPSIGVSNINTTTLSRGGSLASFYSNGNFLATGPVTGAPLSTLTPGFLIGGGGWFNSYWNGTISEVLVYNHILSDADRHEIESYLAKKYNLSISSTSAQLANSTVVYNYSAKAVSPDGLVLTYSLISGPSGSTINPSTGALTWIPSATGTDNFQIKVTDSKGGTALQSFTLTVNTGLLGSISGYKFNDVNGSGVRIVTNNGTGTSGTNSTPTVKIKPISATYSTPTGIAYYEPTNQIIGSVNFANGGNPFVLGLLNPNGTLSQFSSLFGVTDEIYIAAVRSGNKGGFVTGDVFTGNGQDGQIVKITNGGNTVINPWVVLPGSNHGLLRGSLTIDTTGVFGGDLIVVTTNGQFWRVNSQGQATYLNSANILCEGLTVVPNDPRYGPLAGKAISGSENNYYLYAVDPQGNISSYYLGVPIESEQVVPANQNFYACDQGAGHIVGIDASQLTSMVGDIMIGAETGANRFFRLYWDGTRLQLVALPTTPDSVPLGQFIEGSCFAPNGLGTINQVPPQPGLSNFTIYADLNNNGQLDPGEPSAVTAADGSYTLPNLAPGTYTLREVPQPGWRQTAPGTNSLAVTITANQQVPEEDFGNVQTALATGPLSISSQPGTSATVGQLYQYNVVAADPNYYTLTYSLTTAPAGMVINPANGTVLWQPTAAQIGVQAVAVKATNNQGASVTQTYQINVSAADSPPIFVTNPPVQAVANQAYQYQARAQDAAQDTITYALVTAPPGQVAFDTSKGILSYSPTSANVGSWPVVIGATDSRGGLTTQSYNLNVVATGPTNIPTIVSQPASLARFGSTYYYVLKVNNPDTLPLTATLTTAPRMATFRGCRLLRGD